MPVGNRIATVGGTGERGRTRVEDGFRESTRDDDF